MPICEICKKKFPNWNLINGEQKNLQSRKYCLDCSPFGKHNTRQLKKIIKGPEHCWVCNKHLKKISRSKKKICGACCVKIKRIRNKIAAIKYKGGKCQKCGKKFRHIRQTTSFEFHHNEGEKEFQISTNLDRKSWEKLRKEIDNCQLVCSCCHRELHFELYKNKKFILKLFDYKGNQDIWIKKKEKIRSFIRKYPQN